MDKIALYRPGALGDIIMTFNFLSQLLKKYEVHYFCHSSSYNILKPFITQCNILTNFFALENYKKENFNKTVNLIGYPLHEGYPYKPMKAHLLKYFAKELNCEFTFDGFELDPPPLPEKIKNKNTPRYITIQTKTGWSVYKEWWGWQELVNLLKDNHPEIEIYQIGGPDDPQLKNIDGTFCGGSFYENVSAQAWATLHIGLDSVFNHTTNIIWRNKGKTKSVILFGSTQADAFGYPHNKNITMNLPCQPCFRENPKLSRIPQTPCNNPPNQTYEAPKHECMSLITPKIVYQKINIHND
jgi:ADP-heptose:LPS heptosyltransferase